MADQPTASERNNAPDPASSYERAKPEKEAGMGRLDNVVATPTDRPDRQEDAVKNKQDPRRQLNAEDVINQRGATPPQPGTDHSMFDEEPRGEDLMPTDIHDREKKRHPRKEGRGGTP